MRRGGAPQRTPVGIDTTWIDVAPAPQRVIRKICRFVHAGFGSTATASSIARIVDDQQRGVGRPEITDRRPDGAYRLAVSVEPKKGGGGRRGAAKGRQIPPHELRPIVHPQFDLLSMTQSLERIR